jgi:hypothetical protein
MLDLFSLIQACISVEETEIKSKEKREANFTPFELIILVP